MNDILSLFIGVIIFFFIINLLPYLIWLFLIIWIVGYIYLSYRRSKIRKAQKEYYQTYQEPSDNGNQYRYDNPGPQNNTNANPDVIDVEYTQKEE